MPAPQQLLGDAREVRDRLNLDRRMARTVEIGSQPNPLRPAEIEQAFEIIHERPERGNAVEDRTCDPVPLTDAAQRAAYVERLHSALKPGGSVVIATFGPEGPLRCSGLEIVRYDAARLAAELGTGFHMLGSECVMHATPFGTQQQFQYVWGRIG